MRPIDLLLVTLGLIKVDFKEDFLDCRGAFEDGALGTDMAWPFAAGLSCQTPKSLVPGVIWLWLDWPQKVNDSVIPSKDFLADVFFKMET